MWCVGIDDQLMLDVRVGQRLVERVDGLLRDALVRSTKQPQHRTLELIYPLNRPDRGPLTRHRRPVEANHPREAMMVGGLQERMMAAEAKAHGEDRPLPAPWHA